MRPRIIACIQLLDGKVVKTVNHQNPKYIGDPLNTLRVLYEYDVDELILVDISCESPDYKLLDRILNFFFLPLTYAGGVRNLETVSRLIRSGCEKVVIRNRPDLIEQAVTHFGAQSIVCAVDLPYDDIPETNVGEYFITDVKRDGTFQGYDLPLLSSLKVSSQLTYMGGSRGMKDFREGLLNGADAVAGASCFTFLGKGQGVLLNYPTREERQRWKTL